MPSKMFAFAMKHKEWPLTFGTLDRSVSWDQRHLTTWSTSLHLLPVCFILCTDALGEIEDLLNSPVPKLLWKRTDFNKVSQNVKRNLVDVVFLHKYLKYLNKHVYTNRKIHTVLRIPLKSVRELTRVSVNLKILTGSYMFLSTRSAFNQKKIDPTCQLCRFESEELTHFIFRRETLNSIRAPILVDIETGYCIDSYLVIHLVHTT